MEIVLATSSKSLTKHNSFSQYLLIVGAYSNIIKLYGNGNITNEEVMDKLDIFFFFLWAGLRDPIARSLLGGAVPSQNSGYKFTRLCPSYYVSYLLRTPALNPGPSSF